MSFDKFLNITKGIIINNPKLFNYNISIDTRTIKNNDIFIPICFKEGNGTNYINDAVIKGASLVLIPKEYLDSTNILYELLEIKKDIGIIEIDDGLEVLKRLAINKRNEYKGTVIAITGSNGKTSTKELLHLILSKKYKTYKSRDNYNNILGICMMLIDLDDSEYAIFELGMNHFYEISEMSKILKPHIGLITNIGTAHIGNLGCKENILKAKLEIVDGFNDKSILFVNNNDNYLNRIDYKRIKKYNYINYKIKDNKIVLRIRSQEIELNLIGEHNVYNISAAYALSSYLEISHSMIIKALKEYNNIRMKEINIKNIIILDDSYNANYESMINGINYVDKNDRTNKVLVLGDMLELGKYEDQLHKKIGEYINNTSINKVYTYGNISSSINLTCKKDNKHYTDKDLLIKELKKELKDNTIIYFKGSHIINMSSIIDELRYFIDKSSFA